MKVRVLKKKIHLKYLKDIDDTDMVINKSIEWLLLQFNMTEIHIIKIMHNL